MSENPTDYAGYRALRDGAGVYRRPDHGVVVLTGDDRLHVLDRVLSKGSDFTDPDTAREAVIVTADGAPLALVLHVELDDASVLLALTPLDAGALAARVREIATGTPDAGDTAVTEPALAGIAVEGPAAWRVAAEFLDFDVSGLVLGAVERAAHAELPAAGFEPRIVRTGTTGEYGYLLLVDAASADAVHELVHRLAAPHGGAPVATDELWRAQAEVASPLYGTGFDGLSTAEADVSWLIDFARIGAFDGSDAIAAPPEPGRRLTPLLLGASARVRGGEAVTAGDAGDRVGTLVAASIPVDGNRIAYAVIEDPFHAPGLALAVDGEAGSLPAATVALPLLVTRSTTERIG
ncbi:hypothetical protein AXK56_07345 [Tsukamurella pulmonis]|uniref:Glycine cleavage system T protein (Aminomethyltransferase) n=1 Tax=Tsukamurella pulmonis TaxID=47312 RepID=A0A1H1CD22_9ACTN|nr:aminomethyltransferase family protein [Tsukamurella pulmonis]KXO89955.1 hypothetical protein AXK56_07345 [Tsukamurella pulmonis]SDQ62073.1 Glycine cleavage system T protein (aminomethyltransferase) [Tsukamurella pulmonis]SUP23862.1 Aminomethyltransferase [Tsukamurella pulmonis]